MKIQDCEIGMKVKFRASWRFVPDKVPAIGWIVGFAENEFNDPIIVVRWSNNRHEDYLIHPQKVQRY